MALNLFRLEKTISVLNVLIIRVFNGLFSIGVMVCEVLATTPHFPAKSSTNFLAFHLHPFYLEVSIKAT
jgi:hypothetical protein